MSTNRNLLLILMALVVLAGLVQLTISMPPHIDIWLPFLLFEFLIVFTTTFGAPLTGGVVSLVPMTTAAAFLVVGLVPAGWIAFVGALIAGYIRYRYALTLGLPVQSNRQDSISRTASEATLHTIAILASGSIYLILDGNLPLETLEAGALLPFVGLGLTYLAMDYVLSSLFLGIRGVAGVKEYLKALPGIFIYEGTPLVFAPLVALTYTQLGLAAFTLFTLAVVAAALVMRNLALSRRRLIRQLNEIDSLHAIGQALISTLDMSAILEAVYQQVTRIMPVETFFVALYEAETDEVNFPLVVENGQTVHWPSQRGGQDLLHQIVRARSDKVRREQTDVVRRAFGVSRSQQPVTSWLAAPVITGDHLMGVITVQSHSRFNLYDASHEELLDAIAAQAALAIQNAHLYSQTDKALARRVQELDSILNTVQEGILLLDLSYRVIALNRALADFSGVAAGDLLGTSMAFSSKKHVGQFLQDIGYTSVTLQGECQMIADRSDAVMEATFELAGREPRQVERTLAAVRDRWGVVTGWLIVFRDVSEELALQQLRDDMTHMLVHDLRSPLTVIQSSLTSIPAFLEDGSLEGVGRLLDYSQRGVDRVLSLVSDILDIARLESGSMPIKPTQIDLGELLYGTAEQMVPLARQSNIEIRVTVSDDLPLVVIDAGLIGRVLSNLLDNALKFTPRGGRVDLWSASGSNGSSDQLWIGVSDTGPGIPEEMQQKLFEKFTQLEAPLSRRAGTGLGLHYCKLAVEAHRGKIWFESREQQGSTFVIQLPALTG
jgi:NtrC-family two-component system sensor histidine kinase KinB